jgi:hypothetical protein
MKWDNVNSIMQYIFSKIILQHIVLDNMGSPTGSILDGLAKAEIPQGKSGERNCLKNISLSEKSECDIF